MNSELGLAHSFLLHHRRVETKPYKRRPVANEREVGAILKNLDAAKYENFVDFLEGQGFALEHLEDDVKGVAEGSDVWLLVRSENTAASEFMTVAPALDAMKLRQESQSETLLWWLSIWLLYLGLVYTRPNRGISQISNFMDSEFTEAQLSKALSDHVETARRQKDSSEGVTARIIGVLVSESGTDVGRRVKGFINSMLDARLIEAVKGSDEELTYRQSLLGAVEISRNYKRTLAHLNPGEETLRGLVNMVSPIPPLER